jgi:hypothetical protein
MASNRREDAAQASAIGVDRASGIARVIRRWLGRSVCRDNEVSRQFLVHPGAR